MKKMKSRIVSLTLLAVMLLTNIPQMAFAATVRFTDVPQREWYYNWVMEAVELGLVAGTGDGSTFSPNTNTTVAQFATVITKAFYANDLARATGTSDWWSKYMEVATNHNLFSGTDVASAYMNNGRKWTDAQVNASINRYNMAEIIYNMLADLGKQPTGKQWLSITSQISDYNSIPSQWRPGVASCVYMGILSGKGGGNFCGTDTFTRAEMACITVKMYHMLGGSTTPDPVDPTTPADPTTPTEPTTPTTPTDPTVPTDPVDPNPGDPTIVDPNPDNPGGGDPVVDIPGTGDNDPVVDPVTERSPFQFASSSETVQQMMDRLNAEVSYREGYLTNGKPITEENIKEMLAEAEWTMPTGLAWSTDSRYDYRTSLFWNGVTGRAGACNSFGAGLSDWLFGKGAPVTTHQDFDNIKVGDVIWIFEEGSGDHVVVVTGIGTGPLGDPIITVCSGNSGKKVAWDGVKYLDNFILAKYANSVIYSRY